MKLLVAAPTSNEDSVLFILTNAVEILLSQAKKAVKITYWRNDDLAIKELSFQEIKTGHPALLEKLLYLDEHGNLASGLDIELVNATAAYLAGSYYNLNDFGIMSVNYPIVARIQNVELDPLTKRYNLRALNFSLEHHTDAELPEILANQNSIVSLNGEDLERLWPGSLTNIPVMQTLGFSQQEIIDALVQGFAPASDNMDIDSISFD